jgi:hypothetical protein
VEEHAEKAAAREKDERAKAKWFVGKQLEIGVKPWFLWKNSSKRREKEDRQKKGEGPTRFVPCLRLIGRRVADRACQQGSWRLLATCE